jgi:hypothetical protein
MMHNMGTSTGKQSALIFQRILFPTSFDIYQGLKINSPPNMRRFNISAWTLIAAFTISTTVKGETTSASLFDWEQIQLKDNDVLPSSSETNNGTFSCKAFPGTSQWPSDQSWNALNGALLKPAPLASVCCNNTVYNNYDASQCQAVSASWTSIEDRYVTQILNKQSLILISILPA